MGVWGDKVWWEGSTEALAACGLGRCRIGPLGAMSWGSSGQANAWSAWTGGILLKICWVS